MTERPAGFRKLARAILDAEVGHAAEPDQVGRAINGTFARLEQVVSSMVGEVGFRALMVRALHLTRRQAPREMMLPSELAASFPGEGWATAVESAGAEGAVACAALLVAALLELLASFIGADLTFRLVQRAWPRDGGSSSTPSGGDQQ